jgi:diguanylate cyclase (GGDEF)-like protein/PAS domain S-box-containing protein
VVYDFEARWRHRDGRIVWVLDHARGIRDASGNLVSYEGMVKDITTRKAQEQAIELQRNLALALSITPDQHAALQQVLALTLAIDGMTGGGGYLIEPDTGAVRMIVHQGFTPEFAAQVAFFAPGSLESQLASREDPKIQEGDGVPEPYRNQGWQAVAIIPLHHENQPVAVLTIGSTSQPMLPDALTASLETIQGLVGSVLARLQAEAAVRERDALLEAFYDTADIGMCVTDADGHFVKVNRAYCALYQYPPDDLIGQHFTMILPPDNRTSARRIHDAFIAGAPESAGEWITQRRDGSRMTIYVTAGRLVLPDGRRFKVTTVADITAQKAREVQMHHLAYTDPLTDLPNRNHLYTEGEQLLARAAAQHTPVALLYIDIDRVKVINDTLGYTAGDAFLVHAATLLKQCLHSATLLARVGSDEFVVLLTHTTPDDALDLAHQVVTCPQTPALLENELVTFNACIGIADGQAGNISLSHLLSQAEHAMYRAKQEGRRIAVYDPAHSPMLQRQLHLENDLRHALDHDGLTLVYQPILHVPTHRIAVVEALVRWPHPTRGLLSPATLLPLAEELRLLETLDRQVLRMALQQAATWEAAGIALAVSINISAPTLQAPDLVDEVAALVQEAGVSPAHIILEVTEHSALRDLPTSTQVLAGLRTLGLRIALDDFGTGHASLTHLRHLPVDILKLDRAFAAGIGQDARDEAVIETLLALGQGLALDVVVEGIEYTAQLDWLRHAGCPFVQGYLLSKPVDAAALAALLEQQA